MARFLFDILGATGHVKPTLQLAVTLKKSGHEVYYTHTSFIAVFQNYLRNVGVGKLMYPDELKCYAPHLVLLDQVLSERSSVYEGSGIPYIYVESALSGLDRPGVPPLDSEYIPTGSKTSDRICAILWWLKSFRTSIPPVQQLVLAATPLDYPGKFNPFVINIGPLWGKILNEYMPPRQRESLYPYLKNKKKEGKVVLYCSLGTYKGYIGSIKVYHFYKVLKQFCIRFPEYELIVSINGKTDHLDLVPLPENMRIFRWINQSEVLPYCDIAITHGGMNTLTECVLAGVPMLVYPQATHFDQCGNAARIVHHGLGLRGNMRMASIDSLHRKVLQITEKRENFLSRLMKMREKFEDKNANMQQVLNLLTNRCRSPYIEGEGRILTINPRKNS